MLMLLWRMKKGLYLWDRKLKGCFRDFYCWFPFAEYAGSLYLMLDYNPSQKGTVAQIICYVHDTDFIYYIAPDITEALKLTETVIEGLV